MPLALLRRGLTGAAVVAVAWWLLADTYTRHFNPASAAQTIRFTHFGTYRDHQLWRGVIADFERTHSPMKVRQEYIVGRSNQYSIKMQQQMLTGTLPDVALIQLGPFHELASHFADVTELARRFELQGANSDSRTGSRVANEQSSTTNRASPDERIGREVGVDVGRRDAHANESQLDATGLAAFQWQGRQRGLPVSGGNLMIFCNTQCLARASEFLGRPVLPPRHDWTMRDFQRLARDLTCDYDGDGRIDQFGFWLPRWIYYLPFAWGFGAQVYDDANDSWQLLGPEAERAFGFYRDLAVGDRVCPRDDEVPQLFQDVGFLTGKVAMCVNGPWFMPFLAETELNDSYVVAPIPAGPAGRATRVTWDGIVLADKLPPDRRRVAEAFALFVLSKSVQDRLARNGRSLPALTESMPAFLDVARPDRRRVFVDGLSYGRLQPLIRGFTQVDRAINEQLDKLANPNVTSSIRDLLADLARNSSVRRTIPTQRSATQ